MSKTKQGLRRGKRIVLYFYVLIILLSLLTVASYTWFSLSKTPRVSDLNMYINSPKGLEIAPTPESEWGNQLDFRDLVDVTTPLRPVTWSEKEQRFYAAIYGIDGRLTGQWEPLNDDRHANKNTMDGYYVKATLYARTGQAVDVSLSSAVVMEDGSSSAGTYLIGTPIWDGELIQHGNGGQGAETAVRIGIRVTPVDVEGLPTGEKAVFYIYEPNCDTHIDGSQGYIATPSIDGSEDLIGEDYMILQTASTWTEAYPVQRDVVIRDLGEFTTSTELFSMDIGDMVRIDLYVWLEGQDVDCTNQIEAAQIIANIQFLAEPGNQSGLQPIE